MTRPGNILSAVFKGYWFTFLAACSFVFVCSFALPSLAQDKDAPGTAPGTGFEGRVVCDGLMVAGARVYAYRSFAELVAMKPAAVSAPSRDDGTWRMDVPQGRYYLVAKKRQKGPDDGPLAISDYYCFQGSNPITAAPGRHTHVGFALVRYDAAVSYGAGTDPGTGTLCGVVSFSGEPLSGAIVMLYLDSKNDFRGMGYSSSPPTGKDGAFKIDFLPESDYFVLARKRATGKSAGPLSDGDYFGYYVVNPVPVKAGKVARIAFEAISKAGEVGKEDSLFRDTGTRITGKVLDKDGKVVKGAYAFAYLDKVMAHKRPEYISKPVDEYGRYVLNLTEGGTYYIGARSEYGDTPAMGEWYGRYEGMGDHSVKVITGKVNGGVDIVVEKILP